MTWLSDNRIFTLSRKFFQVTEINASGDKFNNEQNEGSFQYLSLVILKFQKFMQLGKHSPYFEKKK